MPNTDQAVEVYGKRVVLGALCLLVSSASYADDADTVRQFNADTPGKGYSPYTVAQGYFQIESDSFHITEQGHMQTIEFLDPVFKYGLTSTLDVALQTNGFFDITDRENGRRTHMFGYGDIVPSFKWGFFGDDSQAFSAALKFGIKIPTASPKIGNGALEYYAVIPTQTTLPLGLTLQIQEEVDLLKNQNDTGKHFNYAEDVSLSRNYGRLIYSMELFVQSGTDPNNQAIYTADIGLSYIITPVAVITAGTYFGLNRYAPSVEAFTGFGFRF